ncbi:MAG: hypothetical protein LBR78_01940 [Holosporales bacterium]|jgi:hypothetical protein|nr:hypothetical protein [Holosporales bacterium]
MKITLTKIICMAVFMVTTTSACVEVVVLNSRELGNDQKRIAYETIHTYGISGMMNPLVREGISYEDVEEWCANPIKCVVRKLREVTPEAKVVVIPRTLYAVHVMRFINKRLTYKAEHKGAIKRYLERASDPKRGTKQLSPDDKALVELGRQLIGGTYNCRAVFGPAMLTDEMVEDAQSLDRRRLKGRGQPHTRESSEAALYRMCRECVFDNERLQKLWWDVNNDISQWYKHRASTCVQEYIDTIDTRVDEVIEATISSAKLVGNERPAALRYPPFTGESEKIESMKVHIFAEIRDELVASRHPELMGNLVISRATRCPQGVRMLI